jgi:hypothetical protein
LNQLDDETVSELSNGNNPKEKRIAKAKSKLNP